MTLFIYKDEFAFRAKAVALVDLKADDGDCPSEIHHAYKRNEGTVATHIDVPVAALEQFSDRVMQVGRQLKVLDLTYEGQKRMRETFEAGDKKFQNFLDEHCPQGMS